MRGPRIVVPRIGQSLSTQGRRRRLGLGILEFGVLMAGLVAIRMLSVYVWKLPNGDVTLYRNYALTFWTRGLHGLPVEYPPLAIIPFTLTLLPPIPDFQGLYVVWMGALVVAGYVGFLRYSTRRRAIIYAVYLIVGAAATLLTRFDIVPALATLLALWATQRRQFGWAYVLIALGILLKLYPGFLLPIVAIAQWRAATARARIEGRMEGRRPTEKLSIVWWKSRPAELLAVVRAQPALPRVMQGLALCFGLVVLVFWGAIALSGAGALTGFSYAGARPLQIESTPASLLWLGTLVGLPAHPDYSFVSLNYVGLLDGLLKPLSAFALLGGCLVVYYRQARGHLSVGQAFVACLCVVIVTNKIFSPQYLIWVLPIVAAVEGFDILWLLICVLTTLNYPIIYQMRHPIWTVPYSPEFMVVLTARNLLLIYVTMRAIVRPARASAGASLTSMRIDAVLRNAASQTAQSTKQEDAQPTMLR